MSKTTAMSLLLLVALVAPSASFTPPSLRPSASPLPATATCSPRANPWHTSNVIGVSAQFADPDGPVKIPDTFNPAEWTRKGGDGGGLGGGGGFRVPDTFNPSEYQMEREEKKGATAVLDRPRLDPGKKYKVLLFNDDKNTREFVIDTLIKVIPGMTGDRAKLITAEAHNNGMAVVGIWMYELAEAYSDLLNSAGLRSEVEEE
uniref:Adaptor protein ClpS core domain-containing protein n=2 Tax=Hemiselmis andersenii TaxID=464988 RepID=A0A6U4V643_HEMAN|mmetsp:Transcript_35991/g.84242  ORF Transcript_35991/g.84242 Transcript_35991/m.84242 type:complete len:203 (-) Transcript_35991:47-655(-)